MNNNLSNCFTQHISAINGDISPTTCELLWQDIANHYNEPVRAYHTLNHLKQLFAQFEQVAHKLRHPHVVALALYYHDVVYDPIRADNELKSAEYALTKLSAYLNTEQCRRIYVLIIMTAMHQLDDADDLDGAYLLDMDLSILGASWIEYEHYAQAVRQEYAHVTATEYQSGRVAVLTGLLAHPRLYLTDDYFHRLEQQARQNIKHEIMTLRAS